MMSQSTVSIPHHHHHNQHHLSQPWLNGSCLNVTKPAPNVVASTTVSLGNLQSLKTPLPPLPIARGDLEVGMSDSYTQSQKLGQPSAMTTPNSASLSTRRQTLLSADTVTTNVSGGQSSPGITIAYKGASADGLVEELTELPDVNQVSAQA